MSNLLYANVCRLQKSRLFLAGLGFMFLSGVFLVYQQYRQLKGYGTAVKLESTFFVYTLMIGVVSAIFCSLFLGVEYSDGTMRNKIIAGHRRSAIYLAHLVTNILASVSMCLAYILANLVVGIPLIGKLHIPASRVLLVVGGSMLTVISLCSVFTMVSLLVQSKAIAPVICIVAMFLSIAFVNEVQRILDQPKYWYDNTVNTAYVGGAKRQQLEFIYQVSPAGQMMQYARRETGHLAEMSLYAVGTTIAATGIGLFVFGKKDMK